MKPLFAKFISEDHLRSEKTNINHYIVEFKVKFDDGHIEEIRLNTSPNFQELIGCGKINHGKFFEPVTLVPWQKTLFNCWKNTNQELVNNCLYSFQELDTNNFNCVTSLVPTDE